jgi:hypothetical protein
MSFHPAELSVVVANVTRIAYVVAGMFLIYLGYRLFSRGIARERNPGRSAPAIKTHRWGPGMLWAGMMLDFGAQVLARHGFGPTSQRRDAGHSAADKVQSLSDGAQYLSDDLQSAADGMQSTSQKRDVGHPAVRHQCLDSPL